MHDDWRHAFYIGILPLLLGVLALFILSESGSWKETKASNTPTRSPEFFPSLVKGSAIFGSMLIGLWGIFSWVASWVQDFFPVGEVNGRDGIAMMLLGAGGITGGFISGWISDSLGVRRSMMICFSGCLVMSFLLFGMNSTFSNIIFAELALLALFFGISQGLLSIYIPQLFPYQIRGTYTGICFNVGRIVTTFAVFFVAVIKDAAGSYSNALLLFSGIFIIGFIAVYFTNTENASYKSS
ncbi:MAG: MFS transporter [Bacteroidota bacterium]